jgi:hypothetical protein
MDPIFELLANRARKRLREATQTLFKQLRDAIVDGGWPGALKGSPERARLSEVLFRESHGAPSSKGLGNPRAPNNPGKLKGMHLNASTRIPDRQRDVLAALPNMISPHRCNSSRAVMIRPTRP